MMSYLADTHALLWFTLEPGRLSARARGALEAADERVFFSIASIWEVAIKVDIGKLKLGRTLHEFAAAQRANGFELLPIHVQHAITQAELPRHHRDPFDRMLIAQAMEEDLHVITSDPVFSKYRVKRLW